MRILAVRRKAKGCLRNRHIFAIANVYIENRAVSAWSPIPGMEILPCVICKDNV